MTLQVRTMVAVGLLVTGLGLAGCGSDEKTIKTPDGTVKIDADGNGEIKVEGEDGTITVGKGLPDGFPEDDVPVVDGTIIGGSKGVSGGPYAWSVIIQTDGEAAEVMAEVKSDFEDAGYTAGQGMSMSGVETAQFKDDTYEVGVNVAKTQDKVTITYLVRDGSSAQ